MLVVTVIIIFQQRNNSLFLNVILGNYSIQRALSAKIHLQHITLVNTKLSLSIQDQKFIIFGQHPQKRAAKNPH
jgi:hypothetical protein